MKSEFGNHPCFIFFTYNFSVSLLFYTFSFHRSFISVWALYFFFLPVLLSFSFCLSTFEPLFYFSFYSSFHSPFITLNPFRFFSLLSAFSFFSMVPLFLSRYLYTSLYFFHQVRLSSHLLFFFSITNLSFLLLYHLCTTCTSATV